MSGTGRCSSVGEVLGLPLRSLRLCASRPFTFWICGFSSRQAAKSAKSAKSPKNPLSGDISDSSEGRHLVHPLRSLRLCESPSFRLWNYRFSSRQAAKSAKGSLFMSGTAHCPFCRRDPQPSSAIFAPLRETILSSLELSPLLSPSRQERQEPLVWGDQ